MNEEKILQDQIKNAPQAVKEFLSGDSWSNVVNQIVKDRNLSSDQKTALENEVLFIILDMDILTNLKSNIQATLALEDSVAQEITDTLNRQVFMMTQPALLTKTEKFVPDIHPMVEEGEEVHDSKPEEKIVSKPPTPNVAPIPTPVPTPTPPAPEPVRAEAAPEPTSAPAPVVPVKRSYPDGKDPYREPMG